MAVTVRAAGGVLARAGADGSTEILVVHRPRYDDWSLPKGKLEPGETDEAAAVREVEEETGYRCELGTELPSTQYVDRNGRDKQVRFWRMRVVEELPWAPNAEIDDRRWITTVDAATLLSYEADREMVRLVDAPNTESPDTESSRGAP